ncbi:MAG: alpha/beta hydrolase [Rhodobacteraceae bacterium]|nr:alpha/beta hydrolase [Paracoccaceae bacterium]
MEITRGHEDAALTNNVCAIECEYTVTGSGPPLFLVHGIGAARDAWRFVLPALSQHFTVITYDLRGHGLSDRPGGPFGGLEELVADLECVRERSGFERCHFAGHSLGGMIVPAYARLHPNRVLSLGLLSTAAGRTGNDRRAVRGVIEAMEEKGIDPVLGTLTDRWFTDSFIARNRPIVQRRLRQVIETDPDVFMEVFRIYAETEMLPWLGEITAPALVMTGENDGGCSPRLNARIAEVMPNARLVVIPGVKHAILTEVPDRVAEEMIGFHCQVGDGC